MQACQQPAQDINAALDHIARDLQEDSKQWITIILLPIVETSE